jgi:bis(5'-nucleosidyl)-tetraphosphatase
MLYEKSCGAIVIRKFHGNTELLLIKNKSAGHWSFPKGHVENGESEIETATREVKEETNIDVIIDSSFREVITYSPKKDTIKEVVYFMARAKNTNCMPQLEEVSNVAWVALDRVTTLLTYDNDKQLIAKARQHI